MQASVAKLQVAQIVSATEAEGPGRRFAIWLQGCPLRCPGCCNPEMLPFAGGQSRTVASLLAEIDQARRTQALEGVTLLGGEPTAQAAGAAELARGAQARGLTVMLFSGYTLAELRAQKEPAVAELLASADLLVDGPYLRDQPEQDRGAAARRWVGSANQEVHFLTGRYRADDQEWRRKNTLEIRLTGGELLVNGFPAPPAAGFWRRLPQEARHEQ